MKLFVDEVAVRTMGTYLKKWGFTPQKPVKRAYQRNDPKVLEWLNQEYPSIKAPAKMQMQKFIGEMKLDLFQCQQI